MKTVPLVITSINAPTAAVKAYSNVENFAVVVAGDLKTPADYKYPKVAFLSAQAQVKLFPSFGKLLPFNQYSRKNLGFLWALKNYDCDYLFETDDDNFPLPQFPTFNFTESSVPLLSAESKFFNVFSLFSKQPAWPRGFPLELVKEKITYKLITTKVKPLLQQSLIDNDSDFDAVYRMLYGKEIHFAKNKRFAFSKGVYGQVNSQATLWAKEIFPLLYFPVTISWRTADIWRGYIAQRILWELGGNLVYVSPGVYQERLRHNVYADFASEQQVYLQTHQFIEVLESLELNGSVAEMQLQCYTKLIKAGLINRHEIKTLKAWQNELKN